MVLQAKKYFVDPQSIVREIWGKSDTILLIFAGASAEFALNKSVDWLYFTGRLPEDPLGRLFSTVSYARKIVFSERRTAIETIEKMTLIHKQVENARSMKIPEWAYRDVLFLLIDYSIRSYELLNRKLSMTEKEEVVKVFTQLGYHMGMKNLPEKYLEFKVERKLHLNRDLFNSKYTSDLFLQYQKHLGDIRFMILNEVYKLILPATVQRMLNLNGFPMIRPLLIIYKQSRKMALDKMIRNLILPSRYKGEIESMNLNPQ